MNNNNSNSTNSGVGEEMDRWKNRVHLGSCFDLMKQLPDESIDCLVTSPPYW